MPSCASTKMEWGWCWQNKAVNSPVLVNFGLVARFDGIRCHAMGNKGGVLTFFLLLICTSCWTNIRVTGDFETPWHSCDVIVFTYKKIHILSTHSLSWRRTDQLMSSRWLQMTWSQIGGRPSATTKLTLQWLSNTLVAHASYCAIWILHYGTTMKQTMLKRGWEVVNLSISLLLTGSYFHSDNAAWYFCYSMHSTSQELCIRSALSCFIMVF